ncbi:MAG: fibronectin type III domain-containing protein, partial [Dehalococcoidia bacterium]|nr:fibronectin type III domain-containing protein [Dehalococcoidia bacterium]
PFGGGTPSGYLLVWREYGTSTWNEVEVAGTSYTITGLTNYASYEFTVVAFNDGGYGDWAIASLSAPVQYPDATFPSKAPLMICWEMTQQSDFVDGEYLPALGTVTYSWSEALDDGGAPLVEYLVEYRDADFTRPQQAYSSPGLIVVSNMGVFGVASMFISVTNAAGFTSYNSVSSLPSMNYTTETYEDVCETSSRP